MAVKLIRVWSGIRWWAGHVARIVEMRGAYSYLLGKPEGKRALGRPELRWERNIKNRC
jgi:hypothetical protein